MRLAPLAIVPLALCMTASADVSLSASPVQNHIPRGTIQLFAPQATIHGRTAYVRPRPFAGRSDICTWTDPADWVSWQFASARPGQYVVELQYSCADGSEGSTFELAVGRAKLTGRIAAPTGSWETFRMMNLGTVRLDQGEATLSIRPVAKPGLAVMNLCRVRLVPAEQYDALVKAEAENPLLGLDRPVIVIPNFHPASCGWLTDFSTERNYCGYSYLAHLDRVRDDPTYGFALSEVNNLMAILAYEPERFEELKRRVHEGRVDLCNAFFLEPTVSLSGGEALVKSGIEGLRWQEKVMGARPRLAWMIDVCGLHEQMAQIVSGLGLDALMYCRYNPTGSIVHWQQSPDGSRVLSMANEAYADFDPVFSSGSPLTPPQFASLADNLAGKLEMTPAPLPIYVLGGAGDYSLPPRYKGYTRELVEKWNAMAPNGPITFSGPSKWLDAVLPSVLSGEMQLPTSRNGTPYGWTTFWTGNPRVKALYRRAEHRLQAAEAAAAVASLRTPLEYPVDPLYHGWLLMCLNMDRNTLWGAAGGMVFEHPTSWDAMDRFNKVEEIAAGSTEKALRAMLGEGSAVGLFNSMNFRRTAPFLVKLPEGTRLSGATCQADGDGQTLCRLELPSMSVAGIESVQEPPTAPQAVPLPERIETAHYVAAIDPATGALASLRTKPSGRELLEKPILLVAERGSDYHQTQRRPERQRLADSSQFKPEITAQRGPVALVVRTRGEFFGHAKLSQTIRFYDDDPRIDFEVETEGVPDNTIVVVEFPLARDVQEARRGIPYGFSSASPAGPTPEIPGRVEGILPAIRWSDYSLAGGGGLAILDQGLPGRELVGRTPVLFLMNAHDIYMGYRNAWLSGRPRQKFAFALYAHDADWDAARVAQRAWQYNCPPLVVPGVRAAKPDSLVATSDNVLVEAVRREGPFLEIRLAECLGRPGTAELTVALPHTEAFTTDLTGGHPKPLAGAGPRYEFPVRPQQIVTLRFRTASRVKAIEPLLKWDNLVPPAKLPQLRKKIPGAVGHPPLGKEG